MCYNNYSKGRAFTKQFQPLDEQEQKEEVIMNTTEMNKTEAKTMTQRDFLTAVINANISADITDFAKSRIAHLDEVNSRRKERGTVTQRENEDIKVAVLKKFEAGVSYTAAEVAGWEIEGIKSTQKASAILRLLVEADKLVQGEMKIKGKGKVKCYTLIKEEEEEVTE